MSLVVVIALAVAALAGAARFAPEATTRLGLALERRRLGLVLRIGQVPGFALPYLDGGSGEALALIHGFGGDKDNFARVAGHLTKRFRVILPDRRVWRRDPRPGGALPHRRSGRTAARAVPIARDHAAAARRQLDGRLHRHPIRRDLSG
jgi:triacylglycerol lipase